MVDIRTLLSNIIHGEASSPAGQLAVADVLQNRLNAGNFGSTWGQIGVPSQFDALNHQLGTDPTSNYYADILASGGQLPDITGGSLYFRSAGSGPFAANAASANFGGNVFSAFGGAPAAKIDPTAGGIYPQGQSFADTASDVLQDFGPSGPIGFGHG